MALLHTAERYEMIDYVSGEMEYLPTAVAHLHGDITYPFFLDFRFTMLIHFAHSLSGCYFQRGVTANLVFGLPPRVLNSDFVLPCTLFSWYIMNYCPHDLVFRAYHHFIPFKVISEALHRIHQLRSLTSAIALGRTHGTPYVGALVGGLVAATASSFVREFIAGKPSPLHKPGYTFTVLSWAAVLFVSGILGGFTYSIIATYLVLVEVYFGVSGVNISDPFPLNVLSRVITTSLNLHHPNSRVHVKDKRN